MIRRLREAERFLGVTIGEIGNQKICQVGGTHGEDSFALRRNDSFRGLTSCALAVVPARRPSCL